MSAQNHPPLPSYPGRRWLILEGPDHAKLTGWRHYLLVSRNTSQSLISQPEGVPAWQAVIPGARCFARGTWEADAMLPTDGFATIKPELLEAL